MDPGSIVFWYVQRGNIKRIQNFSHHACHNSCSCKCDNYLPRKSGNQLFQLQGLPLYSSPDPCWCKIPLPASGCGQQRVLVQLEDLQLVCAEGYTWRQLHCIPTATTNQYEQTSTILPLARWCPGWWNRSLNEAYLLNRRFTYTK